MAAAEHDVPAPTASGQRPPSSHADQEHSEQVAEAWAAFQAWGAPLPPPQAFREYDAVLPGASERILQMAERDLQHRHAQEDKLNKAAIQRATNGQNFAVIFALTALVGSIVFFALGDDIAGPVLLSPSVVMLVRSLLGGLGGGRAPEPDS